MGQHSRGLQICIIGLFALLSTAASDEATSIERFLERSYSAGIINTTQLSQLKTLARSEGLSAVPEEPPQEPGIFMRMYGQFTLLNVLYFGGALLIMGAYSLFMTLAWERCGGDGITVAVTIQAVGFGAAGLTLWSTEEFQFLGGILCTVSTSMVPFAVYGVQRSIGFWPRNDPGIFQGFRVYIHSGWIVMELATILCGLVFFILAPFPFLLFPVSFCIWFLSMDICPLVRGWPGNAFNVRRNVSVVVGLLTMAAAFLMECGMGTTPDYAFWLYLFGLLTFWTALTFSHSGDQLSASLYLLINITLVVMGSHLNRATFQVFGTLGVIGYCSACMSNVIRSEKWFSLWILKAFAAAALFAQAIKNEGNFEIIGGLFCLVLFNYSSILFLASSELYYFLVLVTNLGFVASAAAFQRPIFLWFFTIDGQYLDVVGLLCSLLVAVYHGGLVMYALPNTRVTSYKDHLYHLYRVAACVFLPFLFVLLGHPGLAWIGALGIPIAAYNYAKDHSTPSFKVVSVFLLVFGVFFSNFLQSNILYLICCVMLLNIMMLFLQYNRREGEKAVGCALSVAIALLSVLIHSRFMITIATIYIFGYLSHLAYKVFKNSLLFPLVLVLMGCGIIYAGVKYQKAEGMIQSAVEDHIPKVIIVMLSKSVYSDWGLSDWTSSIAQSKFTWESFMDAPANWILWSGALSYSLSKGRAPYIPVLCAAGIVVVGVALLALKLRQRWIVDYSGSIQVTRFSAELSMNPAHDNHGMIIKLEGTKPSDLALPAHIAFTVDGEGFWATVNAKFGQWAVSMARSMFLPYRLTPHLITFKNFSKGSTSFSASISLGTGHKGSHKMKHTTVQNALRSLSGPTEMSLTLLCSGSWYQPYSKLCEKSLTLDDFGRDILHQE